MESVNKITGIGKKEAEALARAGIHTTTQLLEEGATSVGRMRIADEARLTDAQVKGWVHIADLLRVEGMTPDLAALLCRIEVPTVPKLAYRSPGPLLAELEAYNGRYHTIGSLPDAATIERMVNQAKHLPKVVEH